MPNADQIQELEAKLAASPDDHEMRTTLAELLLAANRPADALREASAVLQEVPDHVTAVETAMRAALALDKFDRADRYRRLLVALRGTGAEAKEQPKAEDQAADTVEHEDYTASSSDSYKKSSMLVPARPVKDEPVDEPWHIERSDLKLKDVGGLGTVKRRLELSIFALLRHADMKQFYGRSIRGGLLLYGPPGCGKTFVARATAGELGARFMAVGLSDVMDMWFGESERKLHSVFEMARRNAPCVLFFDEIDALGRKRNLQRYSGGHNLVNQLLSEMDSVGANNDGVFILGATNHLWDVDTALRRPGRFDRVVFVGPPEAEARKSVLEFHMRGRACEAAEWVWVAGKPTEGFSGADLAHLCDTAAYAMEESIETGEIRPMRRQDFQKALRDVRPSTRPWLETARDYAMFANEGGAYDDLLEYLRAVRMV